jgi:hypothetical protein
VSLDFITRSFYWIPRVGGGLFGTYEPIPSGGISYISDISPLPAGYKPLLFPSWMPSKVFISSVRVSFGLSRGNIPPEGQDIEILIDPRGIAFKTGTPPGAEVGADITRYISLVQIWSESNLYQQFFEQKREYPSLLDRSAGDKLLVLVANSVILDWFCMGLDFIVPATSQPIWTI